MGKDKLRKFAEIDQLSNVYQLHEGKVLRGKWADVHFCNAKPLVLELACGKGEYTVNLATLFPETNFVGVDLKGNRIWRGARTAADEGINNVAFLRIQIEDILEYFGEGEVDEIWITFPDPQPQLSRMKKRLTGPGFLDKYRKILKKGGKINLKTDNDAFYAFTKETIEAQNLIVHKATDDVYGSMSADPILTIKTYYEKKYLLHDKNINYIQFSFEQ